MISELFSSLNESMISRCELKVLLGARAAGAGQERRCVLIPEVSAGVLGSSKGGATEVRGTQHAWDTGWEGLRHPAYPLNTKGFFHCHRSDHCFIFCLQWNFQRNSFPLTLPPESRSCLSSSAGTKRRITHEGWNLQSSSLNSAETLWDGPSQQTKPSTRSFPGLEISAGSTSLPPRVGILQGTHQAHTHQPGKPRAALPAGAHGRPGHFEAQTAEEECPQECCAGKSHCPYNNASPRGACWLPCCRFRS